MLFSDQINVDITNLPNNGKVLVHSFQNEKVDGVFHDGFEISLVGDICDVAEDKFKATLLNAHQILIVYPALTYYYMHGSDDFKKPAIEAKNFCPNTQDIHNVTYNKYLDNPKMNKKFLLLKFPDHIYLSNKVWFDELVANKTVLDNHAAILKYKFDYKMTKMGIYLVQNCCKVTIEEDALRTVAKKKVVVNGLKAKLAKATQKTGTN